MIRWNMLSLNNFLFFLAYQMTIHFNVFCAFSTMWTTVWFSQYNLIGHSGVKPSLVNKSLIQTNSQVTFAIARYSESALDRDTTLLLTFLWHKFFSKKNTKTCGRSCVDGRCYPISIWEIIDSGMSTIRAFFKYLRIRTIAFQWVVLGAKR